MMRMHGLLTDFQIIRPRYELLQDDAFRWLATAHSRAGGFDAERFLAVVERFGASPRRVARRGHELSDFSHQNWNEMKIFGVPDAVKGIGARTDFFAESAAKVFERFYAEADTPPDHLLHVTCTGYCSPSPAQRLVSAKKWGSATAITHAYHMGCYASVPAVRIAGALLASAHGGREPRVDVVHTELCSLHFDPMTHSPEQIVVQTLFADGFIKYSLRPSGGPGLELQALCEELIPETSDEMTWVTADWGMRMTLSRDVPSHIARSLTAFLERLFAAANLTAREAFSTAIFAVHPGGPKIIDSVQKLLRLSDDQLRFSREVLKNFGNMSSATLPHIWAAIINDADVKNGTPIVSLAFGPGLTICGAVFRKEA